MRIRFALTLVLAIACWYAAGEQDVKIYKNTDDLYSSRDTPDPGDIDNLLIWENGDCVLGMLSEPACRDVGAKALAVDVNDAYQKLGESVGDADGTIYIIVHGDNSRAAEYHPGHNAILLPIGKKIEWKYETGDYKSAVHHEMGHAIFKKHVGTSTCGGSACTNAILEHWGLDEGFAMILERIAGGASISPPPADSVKEILDDHCALGTPEGAVDCAHDLGRMLAKSFNGLEAKKGEDTAFHDYYKAVVIDLPNNELADFGDFHSRLGQLIYDKDIRPETEKQPPPAPELAFSLSSWSEWLFRFFFTRDPDDGDTAPHGWG